MYKRIVIAVISIMPLLSYSADWQVLADTKLGQLRLDKASVSKTEQITKALLVYEFKDSQKVMKPPYNLFNRREDDVLVDCSNLLLGVVKRRLFDADKLVSEAALQTAEVKFNPLVPDTMAETVINAVCAVTLTNIP